MIRLVLKEIIDAIGGHVRSEPPARSVTGVSTDSRTIRENELFFAISGPNFDGHDFLPAVFQRGAAGAVVSAARAGEAIERASAAGFASATLIVVPEPVEALGKLAAFHRRQLSADVIAVVGSNGKTTTKTMIDHVLSSRLKGRSSPKSFNNSIGVPITLLSADLADEYVVVEIGTNAPGEVATLAKITGPNMAVITSIGEEHLEGLGDLKGVAREESAVLQHLPAGGFAAINIDAPHMREHLPPPNITTVTFGLANDAALRITPPVYDDGMLAFKLNGRFAYRLPVPGAHNACNATAAVAIARRLGFDHEEIAARLLTFSPPPMRMEVVEAAGVKIINDAYNANPASTLAAIEMLESMPAAGRRIFVFGEMRELGEHAAAQHRRIADRLRSSRVDHYLAVGRAAEWMFRDGEPSSLVRPTAEAVSTVEAAAARVRELVRPGDVVLVKASRTIGLERVVESLRLREPAAVG